MGVRSPRLSILVTEFDSTATRSPYKQRRGFWKGTKGPRKCMDGGDDGDDRGEVPDSQHGMVLDLAATRGPYLAGKSLL